ncbi:MAG: porin, partial [Pseudomonadales bacterium]
VIYQVEQGIDLVHGGKQVDTLLSTRNTFIGVSGAFGKFMVGTHDTPLKKTQGKVDLFNNQAGDIKALVPSEVRARDSYVWHSPRFAEAFTIQAMYVPPDSDFDASQSLAIFWARDSFGINLAIDSKMRKNDREVTRTKVYDAMRGSVEYKPGTWRFGLLLEIAEQRNTARPVRETAYIVSAGKSIEKLTFKMQMGWSDIIVPDARQSSLGVDFAVRPDFILYAQASNHDNGIARQYTVSLGARFKF